MIGILRFITAVRREFALRRLHREVNRARQAFCQPPLPGLARGSLLRSVLDSGRRR
jgi:hypothetical protein